MAPKDRRLRQRLHRPHSPVINGWILFLQVLPQTAIFCPYPLQERESRALVCMRVLLIRLNAMLRDGTEWR